MPPTRTPRAPPTAALLPAYEPPTTPLTPSAQRALAALPTTHPLARLRHHLDVAGTSLTELAGEVNDRLWVRREYVRRRNARGTGAGKGVVGGEGGVVVVEEREREREAGLERMRVEVEALTGRLEEGVRGVIDGIARVEGVEGVLGEVVANVGAGGGGGGGSAGGGTQSTLGASQFREGRRRRGRRREAGGVGDEDEDEGSEFEDEGPTQEDEEGGQENVVVGPSVLLRRKMEEHKVRYEALPLGNRYATNNAYIGFKRIVHDALHPGDDAPPLANASTWFPSDPSLATLTSSRNTRAHANGQPTAADADDADDDVAIASERISIKCPLTLLPYKDPVTSSKCPHSFEKAAILDMISKSAGRVGRERAVQCPVCERMLTPSTLHADPILLRKIKRIQAAEARAADGDEGNYSSDRDQDRDHDIDGRRAEEMVVDEGEGDGDGFGFDVEQGGKTGTARARSVVPRVKAEGIAGLAAGMGLGGGRGVAGEGRGEGEGEGEAGLVGTQTVTEGGPVVVDLGEGEGDEDEDEDGDVDMEEG